MKRYFFALVVLLVACLSVAAVVEAKNRWRPDQLGVLGKDLNDLRDRPGIGSPQTVSATTTIAINPATYSFWTITDNATDSTNTLSLSAGADWQIIYIYNGDASATSGIATISNGKVGSLIYASGSWRLLSDE